MYIKLKNQEEIFINSISEYLRGRKKEQILNIVFKGNYSISNLVQIFNKDNIEIIILVDNSLNEKEFLGYSIIDTLDIEYNEEDLNNSIINLVLTKEESDN